MNYLDSSAIIKRFTAEKGLAGALARVVVSATCRSADFLYATSLVPSLCNSSR